jgi:hypothetical protein
MTAISRLTASEADVSAFRLSESTVTPTLDGLDLPDEVRQKIYYGHAAGAARGCHKLAGHSRGFHGCRGSPRSALHRTAGLPAAAFGRRHGRRRSTNTSSTSCSCRLCLRIFACPPARSAAGRPGVAVLNRVEPLVQINVAQ